jgi:hypothetical protein
MYKNFFRGVCLFQQIEKELLTLKSNFEVTEENAAEFCIAVQNFKKINSV